MIIFFNLKNGDIYGTIDGRVHSDQQLSGVIHPSTVKAEEVGKYVVSYQPITIKVKRDVTKMVVDPKTLEVNTIKVGEEQIEQPAGLEINDKFKDFFTEIEAGTKKIYHYKFDVKDGEVVGIIPRQNIT